MAEATPNERLRELVDGVGESECVAYIVMGAGGGTRSGYIAEPGTDLYRLIGLLEDLKQLVVEDARDKPDDEEMEPSPLELEDTTKMTKQ
jgi:hypothetical protein